MKTTMRFPLLARGWPKRANHEKDVLLSVPYEADVPEVSASEAPVVFHAAVGDGRFEVVRHGEALYRLFNSPRAQFVERSKRDGEHSRVWVSGLGNAFERQANLMAPDYPVYGPEHLRPPVSPLGRPIHAHLSLLLYLRDFDTLHEEKVWPQQFARPPYRNDLTVEDYGPRFPDLDPLSVLDHAPLFARQAKRLLLRDGVMWVETPPPCYVVELARDDSRDRVEVRYGFAPTVIDAEVARLHLPLTDREGMREFAKSLGRAAGRGDIPVYEPAARACADDGLLEFDARKLEVDRLAYVLAADVAKVLRRRPGDAAKLDGSWVSDVARGYDGVREACPLLDLWPDMSESVDGIGRAWKALARPKGLMEIHRHRYRLADLMIGRASELAAGAPIALSDVA